MVVTGYPPGYYVTTLPAAAPAPTPLRTDIAGFAGRAARGPAGGPVLVRDIGQFERAFGPTQAGRLGRAVRGYFDNGGELAYALRLPDTVDPEEAYQRVHALLDTPEVALLVLPDLWDDLAEAAADTAGLARAADTAAGLARAADQRLDRMLILDLPYAASRSAAQAADALRRLDAAAGPEARAVAVYHPWITVEEYPGGQDGRLVRTPPSGHVAGLISRLDRERGPARSPANQALVNAVDLDADLPESGVPAVPDRRVNPIRCTPGQGLLVWGARTLARGPSGRFIAHRRLLHRLVRAARQAGEAMVFEPDGAQLRLALARAVRTVLLQAYRSGALAGRDDTEAFSVRCDDTTTLPADADAGRVVCEAQFTPAFPMEVIRVQLQLAAEGRLEVIEQ